MRWISLAAGGLAVVMIVAAAPAVDIAGARAFVRSLYSHYPTASRKDGFDAMDAKEMPRLFHPSLIALIREDERLAGDEVPALDGDPVCDCQDDGDMVFTVGEVRAVGPARAVARVVRRSHDKPPLEILTLDLASGPGGWRVWDIHSVDTPSLREFLIKSNRERRK